MKMFKHLKIGKASEPSDDYAEMILASGDVGIIVLMELCLNIIDGKLVPADWATSVAFPILKGKGDMKCGMHRGVLLPLINQ